MGAKRGRVISTRWLVLAGAGAALLAQSGAADAHDGGNTGALGIHGSGDIFTPVGDYDHPFNGYKVFLSSPRHTDSGNKGECRDPGREENVNGRYFNWLAANGTYYGGQHSPENPQRNLHGRGYKVYVSPNLRDGGVQDNIDTSANWGSDLHIITHTNGANASGCPNNASYLMTMWLQDSGSYNDKQLARAIGAELSPDVPPTGPDGWVMDQRNDLGELKRNASFGDAYVELQFHDNQQTQSWIYNNSDTHAYHYGVAVDSYLGYP